MLCTARAWQLPGSRSPQLGISVLDTRSQPQTRTFCGLAGSCQERGRKCAGNEWRQTRMPRQATRGQPSARLSLPSGSRLRPFLMVSCTYPAPFHAHTHFLATVCGILVLDAAPQAPVSLCAIPLLQDLHHLRLVDWVNALQAGKDEEEPCFILLCSFPLESNHCAWFPFPHHSQNCPAQPE